MVLVAELSASQKTSQMLATWEPDLNPGGIFLHDNDLTYDMRFLMQNRETITLISAQLNRGRYVNTPFHRMASVRVDCECQEHWTAFSRAYKSGYLGQSMTTKWPSYHRDFPWNEVYLTGVNQQTESRIRGHCSLQIFDKSVNSEKPDFQLE